MFETWAAEGMDDLATWWRRAGVAVGFLLAAVGTAGAAERSMDLCLAAIAAEERRQSWLPAGLLTSIALVESAYRPEGQGRTVPWPWTINSPAGAFYLTSRSAAVAKVEALRKEGVRNIDVGCMQVNLMHHPEAFRSLADAFDPTTNVRYATRFLEDLNRAAGSLFHAVGRYHSGTPNRSEAYAQRVYARWGKAPEVAAPTRTRHGLGTPSSPRILESLVSSATATSVPRSTALSSRNGTVPRASAQSWSPARPDGRALGATASTAFDRRPANVGMRGTRLR